MNKMYFLLLIVFTTVLMAISVNAEMLGDVNGDAYLGADDVAIVLQNVLLDREYNPIADIDGNKSIDSKDAAGILQKVIDRSWSFPAEGMIISDYELTPSNFSEDTYFTKVGEFDSSQTSVIRLTGDNCLEFTVAKGANVYITAKHASTTSNDRRAVRLRREDESDVAYKIYYQGEAAEEILYATQLEGKFSICATSHINIYSIRITFEDINIPLETTETTTLSLPEVPSEITTTGNSVYVSNFSELQEAVKQKNTDIYILNDIDCTTQLKLNIYDAHISLIGVTQPDGTAPRLDFTSYRDSITDVSKINSGVNITGSYYNIENLIIEKAPTHGVGISGIESGHSVIKDCIFRYNNNAGFCITSGGEDNFVIGSDSYRNGDIVQKCGDDADGFACKVRAGHRNYFYNCRSWDNSDDGWDLFDFELGNKVGSVFIDECTTWHNGEPETFTGEYDYAKGYPLDKNLLYVQAILEEYPDFETDYNNRTVTEWPKVTIKLYGLERTYDELHSDLWGGNPNGFKLGSAYTPETSYRYLRNCIAFDNLSKGYDQNNGSANYDIVNGLSFRNGKNYWMTKMTANSQVGKALSFGGKIVDEINPTLIITNVDDPNLQTELFTKVYEYRDYIYSMVYNDKIVGVNLCDVF